MTPVACESKNQNYAQLWGHSCIHAQETWWQSKMRLCMPERPPHLVQELNSGTVRPIAHINNLRSGIHLFYFKR